MFELHQILFELCAQLLCCTQMSRAVPITDFVPTYWLLYTFIQITP